MPDFVDNGTIILYLFIRLFLADQDQFDRGKFV
jgi:hypothetical protein